MKKINIQSKENLTGGSIIKMNENLLLPADQSATEALLLPTEEGYKIIPLRRDLKKIYIEVTTLCNFSCTTCIRNSWQDEMGMMEWATFEKLLQQLKELPNLECVHFGGFGEPMSHPRIFDMLKAVKDQGLRIEMITNGSFLNAENIEKLVKLPLDGIFISLDGPDEEEYNEIRQTDISPVVANIRPSTALKKQRKASCRSLVLSLWP
ncbi:hypothetical protein N752_08080 [Desulforamulus aquiferis]|nr:radical SAM protein [Desulforamulus aquiferis]RYD05842.1 hypothetical protein N752_08080 [Desulforamulus aquiferis]